MLYPKEGLTELGQFCFKDHYSTTPFQEAWEVLLLSSAFSVRLWSFWFSSMSQDTCLSSQSSLLEWSALVFAHKHPERRMICVCCYSEIIDLFSSVFESLQQFQAVPTLLRGGNLMFSHTFLLPLDSLSLEQVCREMSALIPPWQS